MKHDLTPLFLEDAKKGARKICGKNCVCSYKECQFPNRQNSELLELVGKGTVCPLKEYEIEEPEETSNPFSSFKEKEFGIRKEEVFALCAMCDHSKVSVKANEALLDINECFADYCIDCPVNVVRDNMDEAETKYEYNYL